jgi:hypothetical protein
VRVWCQARCPCAWRLERRRPSAAVGLDPRVEALPPLP